MAHLLMYSANFTVCCRALYHALYCTCQRSGTRRRVGEGGGQRRVMITCTA